MLVEFRAFVSAPGRGRTSEQNGTALAGRRRGDWLERISGGRIRPPIGRQEYGTVGVEVTLDITKAERELGYRPGITRVAGLKTVRSSLSTSRTLHQQRYQQLLEETDFKLDAAVITLIKVLPLIKDEEAKRRAEDYLGFVKSHRASYPSVAENSPHFEEALEYLQKLDAPEPEPSNSSDSISDRLNELSNKLHAK